MIHVDDLFDSDLETAATLACEVLPDIVAALDVLMPRVIAGGDRTAVRRYASYVDAAAQALTALPARRPAEIPPASVVFQLLRRDVTEIPWVAPSTDGVGVITVLVDRLRGFAGGLPQQRMRTRNDIEVPRFTWFLKTMDEIEHEQRCASPLRRAMTTLDLTSSDVAQLMGVTRQAVDKWLLTGPPADRAQKIGAIAEIADVLRHRLRDGMPAVVARRAAPAYGDRSMLELIADDQHEWLRESVKDSFDYTRVA